MGGTFDPTYTDEQREAIAVAFEDRKIRPARLVVELAAAGTLVDGLEPFEIVGGEQTVRDFASKLRKRRAGQLASDVAKLPARDAIEALRRRLVSACDHELAAIEIQQRKTGKDAKPVDPERLRQLARAIREAALIPEPQHTAPPAKPPTEAGKRSSVTKGGLAGAILADAEQSTPAAPDAHRTNATQGGTQPEAVAADHATNGGSADMDGSPGSWVREQIGALAEPAPA